MIISIFNQAGGVAKTTLTMNLGYALSQLDQRVLMVDFDPQGSLSIFMGLDPWEVDPTVYQCLMKETDVRQAIHHLHGMDLLPANRTLGLAEAELVLANVREQKLVKAIKPIVGNYDFLLIDCPPSLGMLSYLALVTSDRVLIPIETEFKSYRGTDLLFETIAVVRRDANPKLGIAGFVPTKFSKAKSQHKRVLSAIQEQLSPIAPVFAPIPNTVAFADASEAQMPLALYDRRSAAAEVIQDLAEKILSLKTSTKEEV
jgi:chromosome partitioning protein